MGRLDDQDYEVQFMQNHKLKVGFHVGFKVILLLIDKLENETTEVDAKYPKSELLKLWGSTMGVFFFIFLLTYEMVALAALPFYAFYTIVLVKLFKAWKKLGYKLAPFLLGTLALLAAECAIAILTRHLIFNV